MKSRLFLFSFIMPVVFVACSLPVTVSAAAEVFNNEAVCANADGKNSTLCKEVKDGGGANPIFGSGGIITVVINILSIIIGMAAVIMIILAGLKFVTSGSNPQEVSKAREMILYAIVGLIIAALSQLLVNFFISRL